jgi:hypothetical protein
MEKFNINAEVDINSVWELLEGISKLSVMLGS